MTRVTFENATIRDVISKASKVAPNHGTAFDKAAGVLIEVDPSVGEVVVRATNTEIFYMEIVDTVALEGPQRTWLLPSTLLEGVTSKLPISSGNTVTFDDSDGVQVVINHARMVAKMRLMNHAYYPTWDPFDSQGMTAVSDFAARINQVQWAASKSASPPLCGINLSGTHIGATDKFRLAITPCEIAGLPESITIPATIFAPLMKNLGEVYLGVEGNQLLVMPDESTQIRALIFEGQYPNLSRILKRNESHAFMTKKAALIEMIERAMVMGATDRTPLLKMILGEEECAVMMEDREMGLLGDVIELPGQATHVRYTIGFTPDNLKAALAAAPNDDVTVYYFPDLPNKPFRIDGGSGYEAFVMPRNLERHENEG
jgi:DNA polymerase III sliding clamp (beta) subunit (PCNA family)